MPVEVVRLADSSMSLKAQPIDMPHGGWCKPPARPVVMILQGFLALFDFKKSLKKGIFLNAKNDVFGLGTTFGTTLFQVSTF